VKSAIRYVEPERKNDKKIGKEKLKKEKKIFLRD
jgi:hypothetical protein